MSWHHTGFNVHIADVISSTDMPSRERAGSYLVRSPVSLEKMRYLPEEGKVIYGNFTGEKKSYDALDFLALLSSHITNRYEHRVIYYGLCLPPEGGLQEPGA